MVTDGDGQMPRVLIVEDNELNRDMLSRRLERRGWTTLVAIDGQEGIDAARQEQPDLILMDLSLPEVSGLDATRIIRGMSEIGSVPIIALSAHAMLEDRASALAAGCDEFETKPVNIDQLLMKMNLLSAEALTNDRQ